MNRDDTATDPLVRLLDQLAEAIGDRLADRIDAQLTAARAATVEARHPDFLGEHEVSRRTGLSARTLQAWRSRGKGPAYVRAGGRVLYPAAELAEFLKRGPGGRRSAV